MAMTLAFVEEGSETHKILTLWPCIWF